MTVQFITNTNSNKTTSHNYHSSTFTAVKLPVNLCKQLLQDLQLIQNQADLDDLRL